MAFAQSGAMRCFRRLFEAVAREPLIKGEFINAMGGNFSLLNSETFRFVGSAGADGDEYTTASICLCVGFTLLMLLNRTFLVRALVWPPKLFCASYEARNALFHGLREETVEVTC